MGCIFSLYPEIIPIEYRLNEQLSYFKQAIINTGYQDNTVRLTHLITRWGSADLEGIPVGSDNVFTFFYKDG